MSSDNFKTAVRSAFNEASKGYDLPAMRFFDRSAERLAGLLHLHGHERVLDVATGTGKVAIALAKRLPQGSVTGIDLSEGMLERAKERTVLEQLSNISYVQTDVDHANLTPNSFDALTCGFGIHFWTDMNRPLTRLLAALKPGGHLAMTSFAQGSFEPQSTLTLNRFKRYGVELPKTYSWERLDSVEKCAALLQSVGLRTIHSVRAQMGYVLQNENEWWDIVRYTGFRAFLDQLAPDKAARFQSENLAEIAQTTGKDGIHLNVDVIFTTAQKP